MSREGEASQQTEKICGRAQEPTMSYERRGTGRGESLAAQESSGRMREVNVSTPRTWWRRRRINPVAYTRKGGASDHEEKGPGRECGGDWEESGVAV